MMEAQIDSWDQYGEEEAEIIYHVSSCEVCGRRRSQNVLIYIVADDIFLCPEEYKDGKEGCFSKAWTKLPHDKRWDE